MINTYDELSDLSARLNEFHVKQQRGKGKQKPVEPAEKTPEESTAEKTGFKVSTPFVNALKLLVRGRRRLVGHPERCSCSQYRNSHFSAEPTANLLCVGNETSEMSI